MNRDAIEGLTGAVRLPKTLPGVVVSVDFCEVLRRTGLTCGIAMGNPNIERPYEAATGLHDFDQIVALVRHLMKTDQVPPVENAADILAILQAIRSRGALVIGNTSTMSGCEAATIKFIGKHYPGAFDGVNFNAGGHIASSGEGTKAFAIKRILQEIDPSFEPSISPITIISIDDRPNHNQAFEDTFTRVHTFAPRCLEAEEPTHSPRSIVVDTPLEAFQKALALLDEK